MSCPTDMVPTVLGTCIDIYPINASEERKPTLGISALYEDYIDLGGMTWDLKSICESKGKRICSHQEWVSACEGTVPESCPSIRNYIAPKWNLVASRNGKELSRLNQYSIPSQYPKCVGKTGARMMINSAQEWVSIGRGKYALTRGFWSREGVCNSINTTHSPNWHDYATTGRCCSDNKIYK